MSQLSSVRSQHPQTQWKAADQAVVKNVHYRKKAKNSTLKQKIRFFFILLISLRFCFRFLLLMLYSPLEMALLLVIMQPSCNGYVRLCSSKSSFRSTPPKHPSYNFDCPAAGVRGYKCLESGIKSHREALLWSRYKNFYMLDTASAGKIKRDL
jgi:hypothetical protein